jgi:hypothetical protein
LALIHERLLAIVGHHAPLGAGLDVVVGARVSMTSQGQSTAIGLLRQQHRDASSMNPAWEGRFRQGCATKRVD